MLHTHKRHQSTETAFDPGMGASRIGFREITGDVPSTGERVSLAAWALVFQDDALARNRYELIVHTLQDVGADARIREPIIGVAGETFGNMSERKYLIDDVATIWVTSLVGNNEEHGAVMASTSGVLVRLLATDLYVAMGHDRAIYVLETLATRMAARERDSLLPPEGDTMSRLPILVDMFGLLENTSVGLNRYWSPSDN